MKLREFFFKHPIFAHKEFLDHLKAHGTANLATQNTILKYHIKQGHLKRLRRGLYAVLPPSTASDTFAVDAYMLASKMAEDAILGYHTALELHGLAYSSFMHFTYISRHPIQPFAFQNQVFRRIPTPAPLLKKHQENYGVIKMNREGIDIRLTSLARTLVDVLTRPDLAGGWEEVWRSIETIAVFDVEAAIEYVQLLNNATTAAKLGYFLEQRPASIAVDEKYLLQLQKHIPKQCHYVDRSRRQPSKFIAKWNLMVPIEIIEKTWEEPHENI